jgi:3-methyladenine DNA glycosylase AlkD
MSALITALHQSFKDHSNAENAEAMKAYMKGQFPFFGIKAGERRGLMRAQLKIHGTPPAHDVPALAVEAFSLEEREMHQAAVDLLMNAAGQLEPVQLPEVESIILSKSWWDTVDALAVNVAGVILKRHPGDIQFWNDRWMESKELWLNRTALLFQLKWKQEINRTLLFSNIDQLAGHPDFFIRKAIGWSLREFSGTDPVAVADYVASHTLSRLSVREALRGVKRNQKPA